MTNLTLVVRQDGIVDCLSNLSHPLLVENIAVPGQATLESALANKTLLSALMDQQRAAVKQGCAESVHRLDHRNITNVIIRSQLMATGADSNSVLHQISASNEHDATAQQASTFSSRSAENRNDLQSALHAITVRLMNQQPMQELLQIVADSILELTEADSSYINLVSSDKEYVELVAVAGDNRTSVGYKTYRGQGLSGKTLVSGEMEYSTDYNKVRNRIKAFDESRQACALPLKSGKALVGVLGFVMETEAESLFTQLDVMEQFATLASIAINNSMLLEETREELDRTYAMNKLSSVVLENGSFEDLLQITMHTIKNIAKADNVEAWSLKGTSTTSRIGVLEDSDPGSTNTTEMTREMLHQWRQQQQPENEHQCPAFVDTESHQSSAQNCMLMPCTINDSSEVIFRVIHQNTRNISQNVQHLLAGIANQFSTAVSRQELQRKVEHQAFHDGLTSLPNRVKFDSLLKNAIGDSDSDVFSILFIDLDGFKKVNDTHGHDISDTFLIEVSRRFQEVTREHSVLARVGGDEFAIISRQDSSSAEELASDLLDTLDSDLREAYAIPEIGASIGVSHYPTDGTSSYQLLRKADLAMYHAKRSGKNQVVLYRLLENDPDGMDGPQALGNAA